MSVRCRREKNARIYGDFILKRFINEMLSIKMKLKIDLIEQKKSFNSKKYKFSTR